MRKRLRLLMLLSVTGLLAPMWTPGLAVAGDAVVSGACDDAAFNAALAIALTGGGGTITFDCGGPATIVFAGEKTITPGNSVVIEGADEITLEGSESRHFVVTPGGMLTLRDLTLSGGTAAGTGGSIVNAGELTVEGSSFLGNSADVIAGAIGNLGVLTVDDTSFVNNMAVDIGAIGNFGDMTVTNSQFVENQGTGTFAGAIFNAGSGSIATSSFEGNTSFSGAAVVNAASTLDISSSTFTQNEAAGTGGAILNLAALTITNSTLSNNSAPLGGALVSTDGIAELTASTVTENSSPGDTTTSSGSLDNDQGGQIILRQTIVANQTVGADCFGTPVSNDNNLDSDNSCNLTGPNDIPNGSADLGLLTDNGGPTPTHFPNPASDVVDSGGFGCPATDQRGRTRPSGDACDIGSVEVQQATFALCAHLFTGRVLSPINGQCGAYQFELEAPEDLPLAFCVDPFTGIVHYTFGRPCNPPRQQHIVPDDGDLLTCVNINTSINRRVFSHGQCSVVELPNIVPVA